MSTLESLGSWVRGVVWALGALAAAAGVARAQAFTETQVPLAGFPSTVASGDVNGDGAVDILVAKGNGGDPMQMLYGDGAGGFHPPVTILSGLLLVVDLEIHDVDHDGNQDLMYEILGWLGGGGVFVYRGDGHGGFAFDQSLATDVPTLYSLALGDLDGDGYDDLVIADHDAGLFRAFRRRPRIFAPGVAHPANPGTINAALADMNLDGQLDVVCVNEGAAPPNLTVSLGDGDGGFGPPLSTPVPFAPNWVALGDLNGDGRADAAVGEAEGNVAGWFVGNGIGNLDFAASVVVGPAPNRVFVEDVDADGFADVLAAHANSAGFALVKGAPTGPRRVLTLPTGSHPIWAECVDWTGDGALDIAIANNQGSVSLLVQGGSAPEVPFTETQVPLLGHPATLAWGDIDGDAAVDLIVGKGGGGGPLEALLGDGVGGFHDPVTLIPNLDLLVDMAIHDVDQDGAQDLLYGFLGWGGPKGVVVQRGDGHGGFAFDQSLGTEIGTLYSLELGDVNGDGRDDLALADYEAGLVRIYLRRQHRFVTGPVFPADAGTMNAALADVDLDGGLDVICANAGALPANVSVSLGDGFGGFAPCTKTPVPFDLQWVALGDLNGDGAPDAALGGENTYKALWLAGDGNGGFALGGSVATGAEPHRIFVADVDGDGLDDVLAPRMSSMGYAWARGTPSGPGAVVLLPTGIYPNWCAGVDWTGDGKLDLAIPNYFSDSLSLLVQK